MSEYDRYFQDQIDWIRGRLSWGRLVFGVLTLALAVFTFVDFYVPAQQYETVLNQLSPLKAQDLKDLAEGDTVLVVGSVGKKLPFVLKKYVYACSEEYDDGTWSTEEVYDQTLWLEKPFKAEIELNGACFSETNISEENEFLRYTGIHRGDDVAFVGTVMELNPLVIHAKDGTADTSVAVIRERASTNTWMALIFYIVALLFSLIGALLPDSDSDEEEEDDVGDINWDEWQPKT